MRAKILGLQRTLAIVSTVLMVRGEDNVVTTKVPSDFRFLTSSTRYRLLVGL